MSRFFILISFLLLPLHAFGADNNDIELEKPNIPIEQSITNSIGDFIKKDQSYMVYAISKDDEVVTKGAMGMSDIKNKSKLEVDTIFPTSSISQTFTAAATLLLVERGKIKLSDTVSKHLPKDSKYWGKSKMPDWASKITIHHLLSHSHGLPIMYKYSIRRKDRFSQVIEKFLPALATKKLSHEPGKKAIASDTGFLLLEVILEKAANISLEKFYQEEFFDKLGMKNTFAIVPSYRKSTLNPRLEKIKLPEKYDATIRIEEPEKIVIRNINANHNPPAPKPLDTGIYSNAEDLNKWQHALHNGKILTQESYNKMVTPYYSINSGNDSIVSNIGYGIRISRNLGKVKFYDQEAEYNGVRTQIAYVPVKNISISLLSNLYLTDFAKEQYKSNQSVIYDISDLRKIVLETIRQNIQKQALLDYKKQSS